MPKGPDISLSIIFRTPVADRNLFHERTFSRVPVSTVQEIEEDFLEYRKSDPEISRYRTYSYRKDGEKKLIALDLAEVETMSVTYPNGREPGAKKA